MLCESCSENKATVHLTLINDAEKEEHHFCEICAEKQNVASKHAFCKPSGSSELQSVLKDVASLACAQCGLSYAEFRAKGRLGCPADYDFFQKGLEPLLERIHGGTRHKGRAPGRLRPSLQVGKELEVLEAEMSEAVALEEYERAAEVRDRIRELRARLESGSHEHS